MKLSVRIVLAGAIALSLTVSIGAQQTRQVAPATPPPVGQTATATVTAQIQAIDSQTRAVTLKGKDGAVSTIFCGPEIQRFSELKVGDTVTFMYKEAVVFSIAKPGSTPPPPGTAVVRSAGDRPAGMIAKRETAEVTVLAIDAKVPSLTLQRADGSKMSFKVENPANLEGVKVGDKIQVTYTQAMAVSVK